MRHLNRPISRPGRRRPLYVTDPATGRSYPVPQGGDEDDDQDDSDDDDGGGDDDDADDSSDDDDQDDDGDDDEAKFTQKDLDKAIDARIARERKKHERELRAARRKAKQGGGGSGEEDDASKESKESKEQVAKATRRAIRSEAKAAAIAAGVPKERASRFVSLADLDDSESLLDDDGDVDGEAIEALVEDTLEEWPEFKPSGDGKGKPGASGGEGHSGDSKRTKVWTRKEIAELSDKEYEEHREEIQDQVRRGVVQ